MSNRKSSIGTAAKSYKHADARVEKLTTEIDANAHLLANRGVLVRKKIGANRFWYLRFLLPPDETGHRRHRCLYVGRECDKELVARVRALLEKCRAPRQRLQELDACGKLAKLLARAVQTSLSAMSGQG